MLVTVHPVGFLEDWVFGDFQSLKPNPDEHRIQPIEAPHLGVLPRPFDQSARRSLPIDAVAERGQALRQIAESSDDVWWLYEPHRNRFIYVSAAYERLWKRSSAALYAAAPRWLAHVHRDDREQVHQAFEHLAAGDGYAIEYRTNSHSGDQRWISERAFPVSSARDRTLRMAGVSVDITELKATELQRMRVDRSKDMFLATLGHELRGPLQPIHTAAELLSNPQADAAVRTKAVAVIKRQLSHLTRFVDDLLDLARIGHGKLHLQVAPVRLVDVMVQAIDANHHLSEQKRLRIEVTLPEADAIVLGDAVRLTQVFSNLLHNAIKFSNVDGVICIGLAPPADDRHVVVSVRDGGVGIAKDRIEAVFDFLTQEEATTRPEHGGLGVGLSVVRSLVELHGGSVTARSNGRNCGSEFLVTLPKAGPSAPADAAP